MTASINLLLTGATVSIETQKVDAAGSEISSIVFGEMSKSSTVAVYLSPAQLVDLYERIGYHLQDRECEKLCPHGLASSCSICFDK